MILWYMLAAAIVAIIILKVWFPEEIEGHEMAFMVVALLVVFVAAFANRYSEADDVGLLNGQTVSKRSEKVSCSHSYSCNCRTVYINKQASTQCDTCYEHTYDIDWVVDTTIGDVVIDRINRQGTKEPPRWTSVQPGEPVTLHDEYVNWVKGVPNTLWKRTSQQPTPPYPIETYDYYRHNKVIQFGSKVSQSDVDIINHDLNHTLKILSKQKQVNVIVVFTNKSDQFANDLRAEWLNGKKNDLIVVIGTTDDRTISWASVFGWSKSDIINVSTRDQLIEYGKIDRGIVPIIQSNIEQYWERKPMSDYEYLKDEIEPSTFWLWALGIGMTLVVVIGGIVSYQTDNRRYY